MDYILELSNKIDNEMCINKKMAMIKELNILIDKQKEHYNNLILELNNLNNNFDIEKKYIKKAIEKLEELFNKPHISNDIEEKINIYYSINKYYNDKLIELFN
jgi:hypothetical protein